MKTLKGDVGNKRYRVGIVVSRFNEKVTKALLDGAMDALERAGVPAAFVTVVSVPGAFEIPGAAKRLAKTGKVDAVVCLGAVVRGETPHFEYVCAAAQQGVLQAGLDTGIPMTFGVLTADDMDQALARAGGAWGNKGYEAATDALEMADLYRKL